MQSSIIHSASLHPLGEEHLRMFRRVTDGEGPDQRVSKPHGAMSVRHVSLSRIPFSKRDAAWLETAQGWEIATILDLCADWKFTRAMGYGWVHISWRDVPTAKGWYRMDRERRALAAVTEKEVKKLEWYETLYVGPSVSDGIDKKRLLSLDHSKDGGFVIYDHSVDFPAMVLYLEQKK